MKVSLYFIFVIVAVTVVVGCSGGAKRGIAHRQPGDTVHTEARANELYAYHPLLALQMIDSAVMAGNLSETQADLDRANFFARTLRGASLDSMLGGVVKARFDTARVIAERLLAGDSASASPRFKHDVLAVLVYGARMTGDTTQWLLRSCEQVEVCRKLGEHTEALRTEAELAAASFYMGQERQALSTLDSVIANIAAREPFRFNELDALITSSKRKIGIHTSRMQYTETLPLAYRIVELLDDYEQHPGKYHDGSAREPADSADRADYIRFYRSQAQGFLTSAYAALGDSLGMRKTFFTLERTLRDAIIREHEARYHAAEQQHEAERQHEQARRNGVLAITALVVAAILIALTVAVVRKNRDIARKNRVLVRQIDEASAMKQKYEQAATAPATTVADTVSTEAGTPATDLKNMSPEDLFRHLRGVIEGERLYLNPAFGRATITERFGLNNAQIGAAFTQGSDFASLPDYIRSLRLDHACRLLREHPEMSMGDIATASGFASQSAFNRTFRQVFTLTPQDYRNLSDTAQ